jgi:menaquinone-specific isochorismate synthase
VLAPLCEQLAVDARPFLLRLANVQHLATAVTGRLAGAGQPHPGPAGPAAGHQAGAANGAGPAMSALAIAAALHPTAAVCGTPTDAAMELIRELEGMDRGRYAGPVGWLDSRGNGEWGIALRCAEVDGPRARLFAGGGIVAGSDPAAELAEAQAKFRPMQDALEGRDC